MAYDRTKSVSYAEKHWDRPCDDGVFWTTSGVLNVAHLRVKHKAPEKDGWGVRFIDNGTGGEKAVFRRTVAGKVEDKLIHEWAGLADCAHYLSRCMTAGGVKIEKRGVRSLISALQARRDTKTLGEKVTRKQGQVIVNSGVLKEGDIIGYFQVNSDSGGDYGGARRYTHSTMYTGKLDSTDDGRVTCHTKSRFKGKGWFDKWWLHDGQYAYTFIHFSSDDTPSPLAASLEGYWEVKIGGGTAWFHVERWGTAHWLKRRPTSKNETLTAAAWTDKAYWFKTGGLITILWRNTGLMFVWTPAGDGNCISMLNGMLPGWAKRLS